MTKKEKYLSDKIKKLKKEHPEWKQDQTVAVAYNYTNKKYQDGGPVIYPQQTNNYWSFPYEVPQYNFRNDINPDPNAVPNLGSFTPNFRTDLQPTPTLNLNLGTYQQTNPAYNPMQDPNYVNQQLQQAAEYNNTNTPLEPQQSPQVNTTVNQALLNPYTGVNLETALFKLGQSLNYDGTAKGANTVRGIAAGGKALFSGARTLLSGAGYQNATDYQQQDFYNKLYNAAPYYQAFPFQNGGTVTNGQMMTGAYVTDSLNPNVEIEGGEQTLNSQTGAVQQAVGAPHEDGGIPANLPQGSQILSDHTKIGAKKAKFFRNEFDIKVKATDTYAKVMDKYNTKIGFKDLIKEEEDTINKIEKVQEQTPDVTVTNDLNLDYLSGKMQEISADKEEIKILQQDAFNTIFEKQEGEKKSNDVEPMMQNGGTVGGLAAQYGISPERAAELIKMQAGGEVNYNYYTTNPYSLQEYGNQPYGSETYLAGNVATPEEAQARILQNRNLYPFLLDSTGLAQNVNPENIGNFQKGYNDFTSSAVAAANLNPYLTEQQKQQFNEQALSESFSSGVRGFDSTLGNFTISRGGFSLPYLSAQDKINHPELRFAGEALDENGKIKKEYEDLSNANLLEEAYTQAGSAVRNLGLLEIQQTQETTPETPTTAEVQDRTVTQYSLPNIPVDYIMPPTAASPVYKSDVTLSRLDPTKISPEANLIEANRQMQAALQATQGLPDSQRAAAVSSILGQTQNTTNQAISTAEQANAQQAAQIAQYNAQQADKQQLLNEQFAKSYEAQSFAAQTNSRRDLQQYFQDLNNQQRFNFNYIDRRQAFNEAPLNYKFSGDGLQFQADGSLILTPQQANSYFNSLTDQNRAAYTKAQVKQKAIQDAKKK